MLFRSGLKDALEAQALVQEVAAAAQDRAHKHISHIVTKCLGAVFLKEAYQFKIHFDRKRGKTDARLVFVDAAGNEMDPAEEDSGGAVDVAAFGLRLACLLLAKPAGRRVLLLDEPFRMVSKDHTERLRKLVLGVSKEFKVQVIMITHNQELACGSVVRVSKT